MSTKPDQLPNSPVLSEPSRSERSPHPYHRRSGDVPDRIHDCHFSASRSQAIASSTSTVRERQAANYFPPVESKRRKDATSSGDSGTEADDEKPFLRAITAPPLRPRKGLKDLRGAGLDPLASPLLTPTSLDEAGSRSAGPYGSRRRSGPRTITETEDEKARAKRRRRGRAELWRRVAETVSLGLIGYTSVVGSGPDVVQALCTHVAFVLGICSTYVVRLLWRWRRKGEWRRYLYVPASADPAPLLYPIFLPLFVTFSLASKTPWIYALNYVLSIAALPIQVIPFGNPYIHWILSFCPLWYISSSSITTWPPYSSPGFISEQNFNSEVLSIILPLHLTLIPTLGFLTTTSLLRAELQLLAIALINLLFFATTPQAIILKALLWIGGVSLFVFCRHVLRWSVSLARVPSWRFRRVEQRSFKPQSLLSAIDETLGGWLSKQFAGRNSDDEDSEDDMAAPRPLARRSLANKVDPRDSVENSKRSSPSQVSVDDINHRVQAASQIGAATDLSFTDTLRRRRHTLPTAPTALQDIPKLTKSATVALSKLRNRSKLLLSLTSAQATVLRWAQAFYFYILMLGIIFIPVRLYIGKLALNGNEPVGWALGYLFGDLPTFRPGTILWNLDSWIPLPARPDPIDPPSTGHLERLRQHSLGAANTRLLIGGYCLLSIALGLAAVFRLSAVAEVDTRRKVFHGMMVAMFLPATFADPCFAALALALALAVFLLLDLARAAQLPPLARPLTVFLAPYVDGRDHRGPVVVSHIFLLIGCAVPLWLSLAATERKGGMGALEGWEVERREIGMVAGVVCVGMGDAAASLVGRRYGRRRWPWSGGKSFEGSAAFAMAVTLGLVAARTWLLVGGWEGDGGDAWSVTLLKAGLAACGASFTEAVLTGGNDNVVVPVVLWLLVRGLGI